RVDSTHHRSGIRQGKGEPNPNTFCAATSHSVYGPSCVADDRAASDCIYCSQRNRRILLDLLDGLHRPVFGTYSSTGSLSSYSFAISLLLRTTPHQLPGIAFDLQRGGDRNSSVAYAARHAA